MDTPRIIIEALTDLQRRYDGPIPSAALFQAMLPQHDRMYSAGELDEAVEWARWLCRSRWAQLKGAAHWAIKTRHDSGLIAITDRDTFRQVAKLMKRARLIRDQWVEARKHHRVLAAAE